MPEHPLKVIENNDPGFFRLIEDTREQALSEGAVPRKYKLLTALALDASQGTVQGVRSLTQAAIHAGAKKEEIMEILRVAHYICGVGSTYTAAHALKELF
ncbi:carboxymuconolactone decarboxylase family protein [Candidatus Latescibacterota bacterium]